VLVAAARRAGVSDARVLDAIARVPRAEFVPPEQRPRAYLDTPIPIAHRQVTTQPSLVARMLEGLELVGDERVLEVGSGYGWQTALLATLAHEVFSVERWADLAEKAIANLRSARIEGWEVETGDGSDGLPSRAPFDAIIVSAAYPKVPTPLVEQLKDGGRLVQPIGHGGNEKVTAFQKRADALHKRAVLTGAYFVPLWGKHGFAPPGGGGGDGEAAR
jgi:protein-L-isoaspartate(D-aspartate) O-methyltransferase